MADVIAPNKEITFTVTKKPQREAQRKTIQRLMRMQPEIQKGLSHLARRRRQKDNRRVTRAGVDWVIRATTTKLTQVAPGETVTLHVTPQIIPDIESVEEFLDAKPAS